MDFGLTLPQTGSFADPALARRLAQAAEEEHYASLWVGDGLLAPAGPGVHGTAPTTDPIVTLTLAAAVTTGIRLGTAVLAAPWYSPMLLARSLATLDQVSGGRLTVGLGLGASRAELEAAGGGSMRRQERLEQILEVMARAWRDDVVDIETTRERVVASRVAARPRQCPRPPLLLAGHTPAALERVARRADGWISTGLPVDEVARKWATVQAIARQYGHEPHDLRLVVRADVDVRPWSGRAQRPVFTGTVDQVLADVEAHRAVGADELVLDLQRSCSNVNGILDLAAQLRAGVVATAAA
jgi:probable F420-dependent oxidoreductase